jgi:hypothetical protein
MPQTIFFRVGTEDRIEFGTFLDTLKKFLGILDDLDAAISEDKRGTIAWEVTALQKSSPPVVGITPHPRNKGRDLSEAVEAQVFENTRSLTVGTERTKFMSDSALTKLKGIAKNTKKIGPMVVFTNGTGRPKTEGPINENTLRNVTELTDARYSGYGSIIGNLEAISVHAGNEFRVWDRSTGKPVRCKFGDQFEDRVKEWLRHTVRVSGMIHSNRSGVPLSMDMEELEMYNKRPLPTIEEMSGLVSDFTVGKTLKEYLEEISNE